LLRQLRSESEEEALGAVNELVQGIHTQATTLAAYMLDMKLGEVSNQLGPLRQFMLEQQQEALKSEFFTAYPKYKGLEPILTSVRDSMVNEGLKFKDKKSAFAEVAKRADAILAVLPSGAAPVSGSGAPAASGTTPPTRMSTLTGGGQGGASTGTPAAGNKPAWASLYEK
jgi:hypothetical protein